jgi:hypothetical protein
MASNGVPSMLVDFSPLLLLPLSYYYGFLDCDLVDLFRTFGGRIIKNVLWEAKEDEEFIERSREFLRKRENCLVVIDGLQSTEGWDDLVKSAILRTSLLTAVWSSSRITKPWPDTV